MAGSRATAHRRPSDQGSCALDLVAAPAQGGDHVVGVAVLERDHARHHPARVERAGEAVVVEGRRVDGLLQAHPADDVAQQEQRLPLVLLVAAGRPAGEHRHAVAQHQRRRQRRARAGARLERGGQSLVEPEHLGPAAEAEAELRDGRRALQPAAARGRRDDVAPAVHDVDVAGVAARLAVAIDSRLPGRHVARAPGLPARRAAAVRARRVAAPDRAATPDAARGLPVSPTSAARARTYAGSSRSSTASGEASPYQASRSAITSFQTSVIAWMPSAVSGSSARRARARPAAPAPAAATVPGPTARSWRPGRRASRPPPPAPRWRSTPPGRRRRPAPAAPAPPEWRHSRGRNDSTASATKPSPHAVRAACACSATLPDEPRGDEPVQGGGVRRVREQLAGARQPGRPAATARPRSSSRVSKSPRTRSIVAATRGRSGWPARA